MKYYMAKIKPDSSFASPPMSDTIFGQLIWSLKRIGEDVDQLLENYSTDPFLVVSDFFPDDLGNTPKIPTKYMVGSSKEEKLSKLLHRKTVKSQSHIKISSLIDAKEITRSKVSEFSESIRGKIEKSEVIRCSINRLTGTTGEDGFSPYAVIEDFYNVDFFSLYFYTKEAYVEKIISALTTIGQIGFGKDASVGKGRFHLISDSLCELKVKNDSANAIYTLGNCYLKDIKAGVYSYETFTRFGKHGDILAITGNPFKNPVVTARQGALLINPDGELLKKPYIGSSIKGLSFHSETVYQGYSLYLPINLKEEL